MKKGFETPPNIKPLPGCVWRPLESLFKEAGEVPDDLVISFYIQRHDSFGIGVTRKTAGDVRRQAPHMVWGRWSGRNWFEGSKEGRSVSHYMEGGRLIEPTHSGWMDLDSVFVMVRDFNTGVDKELNDAFI